MDVTRNRTGVCSPGSSGNRLASTRSFGPGFHCPDASTTPTGRATVSPREVSVMTSTLSVESSARSFFAKNRIVGCSRPTQIVGEVARAPGGSFSERVWPAPATFHGSLPLAIEAPPDSDQDGVSASNDPPGARLYGEVSPQRANGCDVGWGVQSGADFTRTPALALVALIARVRTASEPAMKRLRSPLCMPQLSGVGRPFATDIRPKAWATSVHRTDVHKAQRPDADKSHSHADLRRSPLRPHARRRGATPVVGPGLPRAAPRPRARGRGADGCGIPGGRGRACRAASRRAALRPAARCRARSHLRPDGPRPLPDRLRVHDPHPADPRADALPRATRLGAAPRRGRDGAGRPPRVPARRPPSDPST